MGYIVIPTSIQHMVARWRCQPVFGSPTTGRNLDPGILLALRSSEDCLMGCLARAAASLLCLLSFATLGASEEMAVPTDQVQLVNVKLADVVVYTERLRGAYTLSGRIRNRSN